MRVVLLGPPGSGKGTQGERVTAAFGYPRVSTGDLLREAVRQGSELGKRAETCMNRGELVPDELVIEMVRDRITRDDCREGYILDGFPRTVRQAEAVEEMDPERPELAIDIRVEDDLVVERLSARRVCEGCGAIFNLRWMESAGNGACDACGGRLVVRDDDRPEVIRKRLRVYHELTEPLIEYYRKRSVYRAVDGSRSVGQVSGEISDIVGSRGRA